MAYPIDDDLYKLMAGSGGNTPADQPLYQNLAGNPTAPDAAPAASGPSIWSALGGLGKAGQQGANTLQQAQVAPLQARSAGSPGGGMRNLTMHYPTVNAPQPFPTTAAQGATGGQAGGLDPLVLALLKAKLSRGGTGGGGLGL